MGSLTRERGGGAHLRREGLSVEKSTDGFFCGIADGVRAEIR